MAKRSTAVRTGVEEGALFPSKAAAREATRQLRADLKKDVKLRRKFQKDPRAVLGAMGLNEDVQREALADSLIAGSSACIVTCIKTCWFSDCFCTMNTFTIGDDD